MPLRSIPSDPSPPIRHFVVRRQQRSGKTMLPPSSPSPSQPLLSQTHLSLPFSPSRGDDASLLLSPCRSDDASSPSPSQPLLSQTHLSLPPSLPFSPSRGDDASLLLSPCRSDDASLLLSPCRSDSPCPPSPSPQRRLPHSLSQLQRRYLSLPLPLPACIPCRRAAPLQNPEGSDEPSIARHCRQRPLEASSHAIAGSVRLKLPSHAIGGSCRAKLPSHATVGSFRSKPLPLFFLPAARPPTASWRPKLSATLLRLMTDSADRAADKAFR